ncbi:MAG TPA: BadF/BadG/BcrA/BcrD ATPase family protein [Steroidobacteraceae bacterium]|nr:BadF/BadG/BcrA/BcrD ATPase family protein [Steroidobacteraceae bacterium]
MGDVARYFLGVDGGGTKTRFALLDERRTLVADATLSTSYHPDVGIEGVREVLRNGVAKVLAGAGAEPSAIAHAFFGLPAYGEDSVITPALDSLPRHILGHDRFTVDNDMVCGWAGSLGAEDGINIVAGTGSIGYGQRRGVGARVGGWGEAFSDEGSAYWIAMQGLNAYSRMSDGRLPKGPLHRLINEALNLRSDLDLCAHVYGPNARTRGELAQLSPLVGEAAEMGDEAARGIFTRAGLELGQLALALRRTLGFDDGEIAALSYSGGAFGAGEMLLQPFRAALGDVFDLRQPKHEPHVGAALYAIRLSER